MRIRRGIGKDDPGLGGGGAGGGGGVKKERFIAFVELFDFAARFFLRLPCSC